MFLEQAACTLEKVLSMYCKTQNLFTLGSLTNLGGLNKAEHIQESSFRSVENTVGMAGGERHLLKSLKSQPCLMSKQAHSCTGLSDSPSSSAY